MKAGINLPSLHLLLLPERSLQGQEWATPMGQDRGIPLKNKLCSLPCGRTGYFGPLALLSRSVTKDLEKHKTSLLAFLPIPAKSKIRAGTD